jgi:hypothetical protein
MDMGRWRDSHRRAIMGISPRVPNPFQWRSFLVRLKVPAALLAATALAALLAAPAAAARPSSGYHQPVVNFVQPTIIGHADGSATVHVQYTCWGGSAGTHVYIGVKQGPEVNATDHTSSQFAETFYSTNWNSDAGVNALTCDGTRQNQFFEVQPDPFFAMAKPDAPLLSRGRAFVQVCIFDSTNTGEMDPNGFVFDYSMRKVVVD